jgi:ribosome-associated toxin RatA of RatAB toxin-antitoxin module
MPTIILTTRIKAPIQACFNASRNIDLHRASVPKNSKETAIAGKMSGLIDLDETVTWRAKHIGLYFDMTVKITEMNTPFNFTDEQVKGPFKKMKHQHSFVTFENATEMRDEFYFESPFGILGRLINWLFLKIYMLDLLRKRNVYIKLYLENQIKQTSNSL